MALQDSRRRWWARLASMTAFLFGLFVWLDVLLPYVVTAASGMSFGALIAQLLSPVNTIYPGKYFYGYLFIALTLVVVIGFVIIGISLFDYVRKATTDITIIDATLKYEFLGKTLDRLRLQRFVHFHANKDDVEAYYFTHDSDNGFIDVNSFETNSYLNGQHITEHVLETVKSRTRLVGFELYKRVLPTSIFATLLPTSIVRALFKLGVLFKAVVVERRGSITYENDHNAPRPYINLSSQSPIASLDVSIDFPSEFAPPIANFHCHVIRNTTVKSVPCRRDQTGDRVCYHFALSNLHGEAIQISWTAASTPASPPASPPSQPQPVKLGT